jgi:hypothetical protein
LEPLPLLERRLHPEIGGTGQDPLRERQAAFHVEFIELRGVLGDPRQRELLAQPLGVPVVGPDVDRPLEQESFVETVELLLDRVGCSLRLRELRANGRLASLSDSQH